MRQAEAFKHARKDGLCIVHMGLREGLTAEEIATVAIGDGRWIRVMAVAGLEAAFEVSAPAIVGGTDVTVRFARMADGTTLSRLGHQPIAAQDVADGVPTKASTGLLRIDSGFFAPQLGCRWRATIP
jgi:hypothetical protein